MEGHEWEKVKEKIRFDLLPSFLVEVLPLSCCLSVAVIAAYPALLRAS